MCDPVPPRIKHITNSLPTFFFFVQIQKGAAKNAIVRHKATLIFAKKEVRLDKGFFRYGQNTFDCYRFDKRVDTVTDFLIKLGMKPYMHQKSLDRSCIEIWAGFGPVGNTEKKWPIMSNF